MPTADFTYLPAAWDQKVGPTLNNPTLHVANTKQLRIGSTTTLKIEVN